MAENPARANQRVPPDEKEGIVMRVTAIKILRAFALSLVCVIAAGVLVAGLLHGLAERRLTGALARLPDHDYTADILRMKNAGRISEALDWARYVTNNPALPNQVAATNLVTLLAREQASVWRQADLAAKGFLTGSGRSVEEMGGAVASDLVVYGDCRDLLLQGYYHVTGKETDPVVAVLAGVGLLTQAVDAIDWAPAVLKAFRKANALSQSFAQWLLVACRRSAASGAVDPALQRMLGDIRRINNRLGLARSAAVFRHVADADDVAFLAKQAEKQPDTVYRLLNVSDDGLPLLRRYADAPDGFGHIAEAVRKGPAGVAALGKGGELRPVTLGLRYGERLLRTLRLGRPQQFVHSLAMRSVAARGVMWTAAALLLACGVWQGLAGLAVCGALFARRRKPRESDTAAAFTSLIDQFPDMIHSLDRNGNIVYVNRAASLLLGYTEAELRGMNIKSLYPPEILEAVEKGFREVQQTGDKRVESFFLAKDNTRIPVEIRTLVIRDDQNAFARTFSISRDLRKMKEMQESLVHTGRLAAIGELAAGVVHDLNNPLMAVDVAATMLKRLAEKNDLAVEELRRHASTYGERIAGCAAAMKHLTTRLRDFSRGVKEQHKPVDLFDPIRDALLILDHRIRTANVTVDCPVVKAKHWIKGDRNQIEQIFLNLCSNACDAMAQAARKELRLSVDAHTVNGTAYWRCTVCDTGEGIPSEKIDAVFKAFFTTKPRGKGTGLGLSISRTIAVEHNGEIQLASEVGVGTTFSILLPVLDPPPAT